MALKQNKNVKQLQRFFFQSHSNPLKYSGLISLHKSGVPQSLQAYRGQQTNIRPGMAPRYRLQEAILVISNEDRIVTI